MVISELFGQSVPSEPLVERATVLEALEAGIARQLAVLDDASLTGTGLSSAQVLGEPGAVVAAKLTGHLVREIVIRGSRGGPLFPLASQLNDDVTHLQSQRIEALLGQLTGEVRQALARPSASQPVAAVPTALAQLPTATAGFTGRGNELSALAGLLDPTGSAGPMVSAVAGLAGVGKTALVIQAGHAARARDWFGGGVLFIDLHGYDDVPVQPAQALDSLLRALAVPPEHIPPSLEGRSGLYRSVLADSTNPVLVVVDNASSEAQVRSLLPGTGPHKVLVTSRHTLAGLNARLVEVVGLDKAAGVELLDEALRAARPDDDRVTGDQEAAGRVAQMCGGLPMALQIIAALLKADPTSPVALIADDLIVEHERLERLAYDDGMRRASVAAAFALSYRRLDHGQARMFRLLPVGPGPDLSAASAAALADVPEREAWRTLADLYRAHLIEPAMGAAGRWRMHDLIRLYARQLSDTHAEADSREQARDRLFGYYLAIATTADDHLRALTGIIVPRQLVRGDDTLARLDAERASLIAAVAMAASTGRDQAALHLSLRLVQYFDLWRQYNDLIATMIIGLDAARRLGDRSNEAMALSNLGNALRYEHRFDEAVAALREAEAIYRETGDRDGEHMARSTRELALWEVRSLERTIAEDQRHLLMCRETGDRHGEANALNHFGIALQELRRFDEAISAFQEAATIFKDISNQRGRVAALTNLGHALHDERRYNEAITTYQEVLAIAREIGDRDDEAMALKYLDTAKLALLPPEVRQPAEAVTACMEAVATYKVTGDRHGEAAALNDLGIALRKVGRFGAAITAYQEAAAIFKEIGDERNERIALASLRAASAARRALIPAQPQKEGTVQPEFP